MANKALQQQISLDNLEEGQTIEVVSYIDILRLFETLSGSDGMYITDRRYKEYSETGLHFYRWETLINCFDNYIGGSLSIKQAPRYFRIDFTSNYKLILTEVKGK